MDYDISEEAIRCLEQMYESCQRTFKTKNGSIVDDVISKTNNTRSNALIKNSMEEDDFDQSILSELIDNNLVFKITTTQYSISFNGIWFMETYMKIMDEDKLIDWIQSKYFTPLGTNTSKTVGDRSKCIAFMLIAMRAFSQESSMNIEKDDNRRDMWWEILKKTSTFLHENNLVKAEINDADFIDEDTRKTKGSDDPIVNIARHSYSMKIPSGGRYNSGNLQYWFSVKDLDRETLTEDLSDLIKLIFGKITEKQAKSMADYSNELCDEYGWMLEQYSSDTKYLDASYDSVIKNAYASAAQEDDYY